MAEAELKESGITKPQRSWYFRLAVIFGFGGLGLLILVLLFVINGTVLDRAGTPEVATTSHAAAAGITNGQPVRIVAYNIAKAFVHQGRGRFLKPQQVTDRLDRVAEVIKELDADLVFLSEAMRDCGPCPVNQIQYLADQTGMHSWAYGENYNVGLPFYRIAGGNGILSRWPLEGIGNLDLPGRKPFYVTKNNRRLLICSMAVADAGVLLASMHTDSFNLENNAAQAKLIVESLSVQPAICAGDFNARPDTKSLAHFRDSGRYEGKWDGPNTFPAHAPDRTIDYILAPKGWQLMEHQVVASDASDHCAVLSVFQVGPSDL